MKKEIMLKSLFVIFLLAAFYPGAAVAGAENYSWIRGANYIPSYARNDVQIWMDYDPVVIDRELDYAQKLKLNCVRIFLQQAVYEHDAPRLLANFENFLSLCAKHGIKAMPVLFDSCFVGDPTVDKNKYPEQGWMPSPGVHRVSREYWSASEQYARDIVLAHRDDPRIVMWDVMNEYDHGGNSFEGQPEEAKKYAKDVQAFLLHFLEFVSGHSQRPITAGMTLFRHLALVQDKVDVLSFHNYSHVGEQGTLEEEIVAAKALGEKLGKGVVLNEVVGYPQQPFPYAMPILRKQKVGWCFWELMIGRTHFSMGRPPFQGLIFPDGTCYSAQDVAAVLEVSVKEANKLFPQRPLAESPIRVVADREIATIPDAVYGQFLDRTGKGINGPTGLWAEIILDRKFAGDFINPGSGTSGNWATSGKVTMALGSEAFVGKQSPRLAEGASIRQGKIVLRGKMDYTGRIVLRGTPGATCEVTLRVADGSNYPLRLADLKEAWETRPLNFSIKAPAAEAELEISARTGEVTVGALSLMPADNITGFRRDIVEKMKELNAPNYRWSGGSSATVWRWKDQLGDRDMRAPLSPSESNDVGLHEFIALCKEVGAEPLVGVNVDRIGEAETAEYNRDLVLYCNSVNTPMALLRARNGHSEPFNVKKFVIDSTIAGEDRVEEPVARHRRTAEAMRQADPSIQVIAAGYVDEKMGSDATSASWHRAMLEKSAGSLDSIGGHVYSDWMARKEKDLFGHVTDLRDNLVAHLDAHRKLSAETAGHKPLVLEGLNYQYGPEKRFEKFGPNYTQKDGLGVAASLHAVFRNADLIAGCNFIQTVDVLGAINANPTESIFSAVGLPLKLYRQNFGKYLVKVENSDPKLEAVAAWTADRKALTIALINLSGEPRNVPISLEGSGPFTSETIFWHLVKSHKDNPETWNLVGQTQGVRLHKTTLPMLDVRLSACSVGVLVLPVTSVPPCKAN